MKSMKNYLLFHQTTGKFCQPPPPPISSPNFFLHCMPMVLIEIIVILLLIMGSLWKKSVANSLPLPLYLNSYWISFKCPWHTILDGVKYNLLISFAQVVSLLQLLKEDVFPPVLWSVLVYCHFAGWKYWNSLNNISETMYPNKSCITWKYKVSNFDITTFIGNKIMICCFIVWLFPTLLCRGFVFFQSLQAR